MFSFNHFNFNVFDLEKSLAFYEDVFGLTIERENKAADGSFHIVFLSDNKTDFKLELTYMTERTTPYDVGEQEYHLALMCDNFDEIHEKHKEMGIICYENEKMGIYFIEDPDGYWIEVIPPRKK